MTSLFKKLNYKNQNPIHLINYPTEFDIEKKEMQRFVVFKSEIKEEELVTFILVFVKSKNEIDNYFNAFHSELIEDAIVWFAFPKGASKKYKTEISRDKGWDILTENSFETVRAIAIDEDWSALRFRNRKYIKLLSRKKHDENIY